MDGECQTLLFFRNRHREIHLLRICLSVLSRPLMQKRIVVHTVLAKAILMPAHASRLHTQVHIDVSTTPPHADHLHRVARQHARIVMHHPIHYHIVVIHRIGRLREHLHKVKKSDLARILRVRSHTPERGVCHMEVQCLMHRKTLSMIHPHRLHHALSISLHHHQICDDGRIALSVLRTSSARHQPKNAQGYVPKPPHYPNYFSAVALS